MFSLCGISQGSVMGPLLFLLYMYVNDLPHCLDFVKTILFADDTAIYFSHQNLQELYNSDHESFEKLVYSKQMISQYQ